MIHPKVLELVEIAKGTTEAPILVGIPNDDFSYALQLVLKGGSADVGPLLERHKAEQAHCRANIEALWKANRIAMALKCWEQANKNAGIADMEVIGLIEAMQVWLERTGTTPDDLGISAIDIAQLSAGRTE